MKKHIFFFCLLFLVFAACGNRKRDHAPHEPSSTSGKPEAKIEYYTCSMHPFIHQDQPGNCPICGMKLVPVYAQPAHSPLERQPSTSGSVILDEGKRQLIGVRSEVVTKRPLVREIEAAGRVAYDPELLVAQSDYLIALRSGGGELSGLQGSFAEAAKRRLQVLGMSEAQIAQLRKRGKADFNLLVPESGKSVLAYASVFESDLPWIKNDMPIWVEWPGSGIVYTTKLDSVDPVLNPSTRTATLRFSLPNPEGKLKSDLYLKVRLKAETEPVLAIPNEALVDTGLRQLVYVESAPGRYAPRPVKVGRRASSGVEVLSGLQEGERIVTNGNFLIDSESRLRGGGDAERHQH